MFSLLHLLWCIQDVMGLLANGRSPLIVTLLWLSTKILKVDSFSIAVLGGLRGPTEPGDPHKFSIRIWCYLLICVLYFLLDNLCWQKSIFILPVCTTLLLIIIKTFLSTIYSFIYVPHLLPKVYSPSVQALKTPSLPPVTMYGSAFS